MTTASLFHALRRAALGAALVLSFAAGAAAQGLQEGQHYIRLKNPMPVETGKNVEVIEFFSYGCPHCGELEPILQGWLKNKPADVTFRRIPVIFQPRWENLAKIYYTLDAMGQESKLSPEIFIALHAKGAKLWEEKEFLDWAASKGLDRAKVAEVFNSFAVTGRVNRSKQLAQAYGIQSVPTLVVDGKYQFGSERLPQGHASVPAALDALVQKARAERPKS
ncbi:MAG: thiol:disulfide interchange protein DsbA/DsbL [Burkholderiales bacterium]|nr:thiol:disulfide interchange protein DsbA/DsbL [Burkholderiales bacterium]